MDGDIYQTQFYSRIKPLRCPFSCIVPFHLRERNERIVENSSWRKHLTDREIKTRHAIPTEKRGKVLLFFSVREQTIVTISFFPLFFFFISLHVIPSTIYRKNTVQGCKEKCEDCSFFLREKLFFRQRKTISSECDDVMNKEEKNIVETFLSNRFIFAGW